LDILIKNLAMNNHDHFTRRDFFKSAGLGAAAMAGLPLLAQTGLTAGKTSTIHDFFTGGDVVLFQGDSITDAGRNKNQELPNDAWSFGMGYASHIAAWLLEAMPGKNMTLYNRGISGNKVYQLTERWDKDCLDLKPTVLSILIGVNDYWHSRNGNYDGTPEIYENDFRKLLSRTMEALPHLRLVICQPFILPGTRAVDESWLEPFSAYQATAKKIADEFRAIWVPFQETFNKATLLADPTYWTADGVHPSMAGAQLMAKSWLASLE
jgi:lysophospholipase L1-like esterase